MAKGHKTGGRVAGTPNRKTEEAAELLESLGCNPIEGMARIAMNEKHAPELRGRMYAELAQYVCPKRKAMELSGPGDGPLKTERRFIVELVPSPQPKES
jgi:hypothetical protein